MNDKLDEAMKRLRSDFDLNNVAHWDIQVRLDVHTVLAALTERDVKIALLQAEIEADKQARLKLARLSMNTTEPCL